VTQIKECTFPNIIFLANHVEPFILTDGDYELITNQAEETLGDSGDTVENLTEAPNQGSEDLDPSAPNPIPEGKPRT
jgi:hypothetical protein